jgi:hypothetical protein
MTIKNVIELHDAGESPWPKVSPEFDTAMIKALKTGTFEEPESGKTFDMNEAREASIAATGVTPVALAQLKDTQNRPVVLGKRYLFREANRERDRMTDFEDNNLKRVVSNAKWHDGIYLKLWKSDSFGSNPAHTAKIEYPGRGKWLQGTSNNNDVKLTDASDLSIWIFQDQGRESHGFPSYALYAEHYPYPNVVDGDGFMKPTMMLARAGYDNDWEWRAFTTLSDKGFFTIALERVDYNE